MYDLLTYEKGAAVVRMLEQHLGIETRSERVFAGTSVATPTETPRRAISGMCSKKSAINRFER